jgi:hypothetical protein
VLGSGNAAKIEKTKSLLARAMEIDPYFADSFALLSMTLYKELVYQSFLNAFGAYYPRARFGESEPDDSVHDVRA